MAQLPKWPSGWGQRVGEELRSADLAVEVLSAEQMKEVQSYDEVVLGSEVYAGSWMKPVVELL